MGIDHKSTETPIKGFKLLKLGKYSDNGDPNSAPGRFL